MIKTIEELRDFLIQKGVELESCTEDEIRKIENRYNVILPKSYKNFLLLMGKDAGVFMKGSSVFYDEVFELRSWASDLIMENDLKPLPDNSFVFWMHQGYQLAFFKIGEGDNPFIYYYSEGKSQIDYLKTEYTFIEFLRIQLKFSFPEEVV